MNGVCGKWSWRDEGKEGSDFPDQIREVGEGGICGGVCGGGGEGVRGGCQRKREGSNRAEAANLQSGTKPMSSY